MNKKNEKPYLMLDWVDIQDMLAGQHPLILLNFALKDAVTHNPPAVLEMGDYLSNAEFLCQRLVDSGISLFELSSIDLYTLTSGLTDVSDCVLGKIVEIVGKQRKGILRQKPLVSGENLKPIKRKVPLHRGTNYADPTNKAFPLDTPERVRASHAHLHKYWQTPAKSGITASYGRKKFVEVHDRVLTRMKRLGIQHTPVDSLDTAANKFIKAKKAAKADMKDSQMASEMSSRDEENKYRNVLEVILSEHITFLKNYILANDMKDNETAMVMQKALTNNAKAFVSFVHRYISDDVSINNEFALLWQDYVSEAMTLAVGNKQGDAKIVSDSSINLSVIKDKIVEFFVKQFGKVAKQTQLDKSFTNWITYMGQYIESRDKDDVIASSQHLKDWQKAKDEFAGYIAKWIVAKDDLKNLTISPEDAAKKKAYDDAYKAKEEGDVGDKKAIKPYQVQDTPRQGVDAAALPDTGVASPAVVTPATNTNPVTTTVYNPRGVKKPRDAKHGDGTRRNLEDGSKRRNIGRDVSGHIPYGSSCEPNARTGRCYKRH